MKQFIKETIFTLLLSMCFGGNLFARDELVFDLAKETGSNLLTSDFVQIYFTDATLCIDTGGKGLYYQLEIGGKINFQVESFDVVIREIVLEYANGKSYTHPCYVDYSSWAPAFVWQLESDVVSVGIRDIDNGQAHEADAWYSLDGRKLNGKPATKGIFIRNNKKVPVK